MLCFIGYSIVVVVVVQEEGEEEKNSFLKCQF